MRSRPSRDPSFARKPAHILYTTGNAITDKDEIPACWQARNFPAQAVRSQSSFTNSVEEMLAAIAEAAASIRINSPCQIAIRQKRPCPTLSPATLSRPYPALLDHSRQKPEHHVPPNRAFLPGPFRTSPAETEGTLIYDPWAIGKWDIPALRTLLESVISSPRHRSKASRSSTIFRPIGRRHHAGQCPKRSFAPAALEWLHPARQSRMSARSARRGPESKTQLGN